MMPLLFVALCCGGDAEAGGAYLYQPAYCLDEVLRAPTRPYVPQPGDIMILMLAAMGVFFFGETLDRYEVLGIVLAVGAIALLARFG